MKSGILLASVLIVTGICHGQALKTIYSGISSDSLHSSHQLEFLSDSTVELMAFPRHMSPEFRSLLSYRRRGDILTICPEGISRSDSAALTDRGFQQYLYCVTLAIEGKALTDDAHGQVFVPDKDFGKQHEPIYIIDGEIFKQKTPMPDSYGLVYRKAKRNRTLKKRLAAIKEDLVNYDVKVYKGLNAYRRFGYEAVFGVIELTKRK